MREWTTLTCLLCRFRHSPRRFIKDPLTTVDYPAAIVTGGGRGVGFRVLRYLPWSGLRVLEQDPEAWRAINCEYAQLANAHDMFYETFGYLSPRVRQIIDSLNNEIFGLRQQLRELRDRHDRQTLMLHGGHENGSFGRHLEEIQRRDSQERSSTIDLLK
ncbi:MAG TPA: hypothetical protein VE955_06295 [Candidatus Dormibacteraeota bacterium]|nr:hypothetical protein [Candidatus Dormibacteraeota bacterium]